jgi:hypothetical protein
MFLVHFYCKVLEIWKKRVFPLREETGHHFKNLASNFRSKVAFQLYSVKWKIVSQRHWILINALPKVVGFLRVLRFPPTKVLTEWVGLAPDPSLHRSWILHLRRPANLMVELCLAIQRSCQLQVRMISTSTYLRDILMHLNQTCFATLSLPVQCWEQPRNNIWLFTQTQTQYWRTTWFLRGILNKCYWNFVLYPGFVAAICTHLWLYMYHIEWFDI